MLILADEGVRGIWKIMTAVTKKLEHFFILFYPRRKLYSVYIKQFVSSYNGCVC